jgi:F-type H+-transporting ATPase subunit gamma
MANLRDVRLRIRAIKQTLKVTRAMNLISTSKLRSGKQVLANTVPYFMRIQRTLADIINNISGVQSHYFKRAADAPACIIAVTSDKGLAGGYNASVFHYCMDMATRMETKPVIVLVGQVGIRYFGTCPYSVIETFSFESKLPTLSDATEIATYVLSQFDWGGFGEIHIVYTRMYNAVKQAVVDQQLLPFDREAMHRTNPARDASDHFEYVPSPEEVFEELAPQYVAGVIYGALVEAYTSEQSQRMNAMDQASRNAQDMLDKQQLFYNRARQAQITQEITEIVAGTAALK